MQTEPQAEHQWLEQFVGQWTSEMECSTGPDQPPVKSSGTEGVRSLGGLWIIAEGAGEMPEGGTSNTIMTLGYDPQMGCFVGSFIGSMMTRLWIYNGSLDPAGKVLTLDTEGPNFSQGAIAPYKDIIEFVSKDHRIMTSQIQMEDGSWNQFMIAHYRRQK